MAGGRVGEGEGRSETKKRRRRKEGREGERENRKEVKVTGGEGGEEDGWMDTGTGRSVGIGLSVLWYRVIVQRKHVEWFFTS